MKKPVIFIAFANDKVDDTRYLRNLSAELHAIRTWILQAEADNLCELVERTSVTVSDIIEVFENPKYKDRIAVFHYGGHADGFSLLLESSSGSNTMTDKDGLVSFFSKQHSLKLIFLNGCSSEGQTDALLKAGIPAVIGTMSAINDELATQIASRFYKSLSMGAGIEQAWNSAIDEVKMTANKLESLDDGEVSIQTRALHWKGKVEKLDQFPWKINFKDGGDLTRKWNLPDESENPLFGLPPVPQTYTLPETPFLYLQRYERKHAEIYFGRSTIIRNFYQLITDKNAPTLILLYGQSGVGKSSLLEAGLEPRLEEAYHVLYLRRDDKMGLSETMLNALNEILGLDPDQITKRSPTNQDISILIDQLTTLSHTASPSIQPDLLSLAEKLKNSTLAESISPTKDKDENNHGLQKDYISDLKAAWLAVEKHVNKPMVVIMDQVEEAYTRGTGSVKLEFTEFFTHLRNLLNNRSIGIQGKLVLSFRKEYQSEVDNYCKSFELSRSNIFLEHIDKEDIQDLFRGFEQNPRLKSRYNLTVATGVAETIGEDLTDETGTPIAAMLQILLTKMWYKATERSASNPVFSHELYREIRQEGIAMDEFLNKQLDALAIKHPQSSKNGLTIDVLAMYTTVNDTATSKTHEELTSNYPLAKDEVIAITHSCQDLFLLTSIGTDPHRHMLAHDTLAKSVKKLYHASTAPLQQAKRIVSSKMESIRSGAENAIFDEWDLALLDKVNHLLPSPDNALKEVLNTSSKANESRKREIKNRALIKALAVISIIIVTITITYLYIVSVKTELKATINQKAAIASINIDKDPTFSFQEVGDAYVLQKDQGNALVNSTLISAFYSSSSNRHPFYKKIFESELNINELLVSKNARIFIPRNNDYRLDIIDHNGNILFDISCDDSPNSSFTSIYWGVTISPDGNYIIALMSDKRIQIWALTGNLLKTLDGPYFNIAISPDGKEWVATMDELDVLTHSPLEDTDNGWGLGTIVHVFDNQGNLKSKKCIDGLIDDIYYHPNLPYFIFILQPTEDKNSTNSTILVNSINVVDYNWKTLKKINSKLSPFWKIEISQNGDLIAASYENGDFDLWNKTAIFLKSIPSYKENNDYYSQISFSNNDSLIAIAKLDTFATIYNIYKNNTAPIVLKHKEMVTCVKFSPFTDMIVTGSADGTAKVWNSKGELLFQLLGHKNDVTDIHFETAKTLYSTSADGQILRWTLGIYEDQTITIPNAKVTYIDLDSTDRYLVSTSTDHILRIWDMSNNKMINNIDFKEKDIVYANFISKTEIIGSTEVGPAFYMKLMDKTPTMLLGHTKRVGWLSNLGEKIITVGEDSTLRFWNKNGSLLKTILSQEGKLTSLAAAQIGKKIAVGSSSGAINIYDENGKIIKELIEHRMAIIYLDISLDGKTLVSTSQDGECIIWNLENSTTTLLHKIKCSKFYPCQYNSALISNDQKHILTASTDRIARLWDFNGKLVSSFIGHKGDIVSAYFSNDDKTIYTFSKDYTLRLWDTKGKNHGVYNGHTGIINNAFLASNNKKIYSCSDDGTIRTWLTPSGIFDWMLDHEY